MPWTRAERRRNFRKKVFKGKRKVVRLKRRLNRRLYGVHVSKVLARLTLRQRILLNAGLRKALVKFTTKSSKLLKTNQLRQAMLKTLLQRWIIKGAKTSKLETREAMAPVKRRFISTLKNEVISKRSKELDYSNFVEKGYVKHENNKQYNKVLADATSMTEDLPVFALDLYNLYLQNLESTDPVKLQKWVTKAYKNKTNKQYRKLLLDYTKLLKSFYNEVAATRIKKKTAAHNAVQLINQFSRVAGSRTTNPLNKRWKHLSAKTVRFYLRHKHYQKFWRTKKSLFKMKVVMARMLLWLYNSTNTKYLLSVKLRNAFFQDYETDKRFIYKKKIKLHLKSFKDTAKSVYVSH